MDFSLVSIHLSVFLAFISILCGNPPAMKNFISGLFLILIILHSACDSSPKMASYELLPSPRELSISGQSELDVNQVEKTAMQAKELMLEKGDLSTVEVISFQLITGGDESSESYHLEITKDQIRIQAPTSAGLWYGLMTLNQIIQDAKDQDASLPVLSIKDEPALAYRAVHLDVKHHLEKKEYYFELMDRFAALKINAVIVEIEDKLKYERQPKVGSSDAFTIAEWRELSEFAMARNIRISPLVQGLGHASFILKHPEYIPLRDDPESDWAFNPLNEETYQVQFDLYEDALEAFPYANYLHVGGDEVHTTGRNSGKSPLELQLIWLNRVSEYAAQKGLTPIFWDDMPLKNAEVYRSIYDSKLNQSQVDSIWSVNEPNLNKYIDLFPKNCVYMRWNYDMPESPGNNRAIQWFTDHGLKVMGATAGQTRWNLMPQDQSNTNNIRDFALISIRNKADGLLLTLWDDDSPHFELYQRGIALFAEYTWAGEKRSVEQLHQAYRQRAFGPALATTNQDFINALEGPVAEWKNLLLENKRDRNRLRNLDSPLDQAILPFPNLDSAGTWTEKNASKIAQAQTNLARVDSILAQIQEAKKSALRNTYQLEVYEQVAQVVQFSNRAILTLAELDEPSGEKREVAKSKLQQMEAEWASIQSKVEEVYGKTRQLNKPSDYILDQDHHHHLANQALAFKDWQFYVEGLFLEKLKREIK